MGGRYDMLGGSTVILGQCVYRMLSRQWDSTDKPEVLGSIKVNVQADVPLGKQFQILSFQWEYHH